MDRNILDASMPHLVIYSCLQTCTMYYNLTLDSCCDEDYKDRNRSNDIEKLFSLFLTHNLFAEECFVM